MFEGKNYVNGKFVESISGNTFRATNPSTEKDYGTFPSTSNEEVKNAVHVARIAQEKWKKESRVKRSDYFDNLAQLLKRDHQKLRDAISIETGKSLNESGAEITEMLHMCQVVASSGRQSTGQIFASELATKDAYVIRKPRGVVAVISPWNFPLLGSFWNSAPAIIEGNTVVHKPSELTPMIAQLVAELYNESGFPNGVYNLIHGCEKTGSSLVRSDVNVILFTGSYEVSQDIRIHCAETIDKTVSSECGSKSAVMIFEDGNLDLAINAATMSAFKLSGQRCVSSGRLLVQRSIFEKFKVKFLERVKDIKPGNPFVTDAFYGPMISKDHKEQVQFFNRMAMNDKDVNVLLPVVECVEPGYFLSPFVYECEWGNKEFLKQEVFGPHLALIPFTDLDDAIRIYEDTDYGLSLGVITDDFRKHREIAQRCNMGMLYINGGSVGAESHLPFSSWKKSGWGTSASDTWKAVTHTTAITVNYEENNVSWAQGLK